MARQKGSLGSKVQVERFRGSEFNDLGFGIADLGFLKRILNVEGRNSIDFYLKGRAQRFHPSKFCGSLFMNGKP